MSAERDPTLLRRASDSPTSLVDALELAKGELPSPAEIDQLALRLESESAASGDENSTVVNRRRNRPSSIRPMAAGATVGFKLLLAAAVLAAGVGGAIFWSTRALAPIKPQSNPTAPPAPARARAAVPADTTNAPPHEEPEPPVQKDRAGAPRIEHSSKPPDPSESTTAELPKSADFADTEANESTLLGRAEQLLASNPSAALGLTDQHAKSFPSGALAQEREFIAIQALVALGRRDEAVARAARFRSSFPASAHLRRLDILLGK
jgi:hypothetical protein